MRRGEWTRNAKDGPRQTAPLRTCRPPRRRPIVIPMRPAVRLLLACAILAAWPLRGADPAAPDRHQVVEVEATWTSIYIGTVSLKMPPFARTAAGDFESTYVARVFPYFFSNENGRIAIRVSDDSLRRLERGEVIEFTGQAVNQQGEERRVEGKATPADSAQGKIKVRVRVSPRIELIFNTTYRFPGQPTKSFPP